MLKLFTRLSPLGKGLLAVAALVVVWIVVVLLVTTIGATSIQGRTASGESEQYTWSGGPILIETSTTRRTSGGSCTVQPENGEQRQVPSNRSRGVLATGADPIEPWFSGSATVTCRQDANVYAGTMLTLHGLVRGTPLKITIGIAVVLILGAFFTSGSRRSR